MRTHPGGAEAEITMLFADVRGSSGLAERMSATEYSRLMNRFYAAATRVLIKTDALINKLVGDEVVALYVPLLTGPNHARPAVEAAQELLGATGHGAAGGPWLPIGVGVHTGTAFVGIVSGEEGSAPDWTALGDNVNITARLASAAGPGEALISDAACAAASLDHGPAERRQMELRGRNAPVSVRVLRATSVHS